MGVREGGKCFNILSKILKKILFEFSLYERNLFYIMVTLIYTLVLIV